MKTEFQFNPNTGTMEPVLQHELQKPVAERMTPVATGGSVDIVERQKSTNLNVNEKTVQFKVGSDRKVINIMDEKTHEVLCCISGYDLHWAFNLKELGSVARVEQCLDGLTKLFRNQITEAFARAIK